MGPEGKGRVIDAREVAGARWLVLLGAEREGVDVYLGIGVVGGANGDI